MKLAPIAIFAYNRPKHLARTLTALRGNILAPESTVTVFLDAPRDPSAEPDCNQTLAVAESASGFAGVNIVKRTENLGCRKAIITGISQMLENSSRVIIVEDDIITSKYFLKYMNEALDFYANDKRIHSVSGYNYPPDTFRSSNRLKRSYIFSPIFHCWGWGTWRDRWEGCDWSLETLKSSLADPVFAERLRRVGDKQSAIADAVAAGVCDTWDVTFAMDHLRKDAWSLVPVVSYTDNIGFSGVGRCNSCDYGFSHNNLRRCRPPADFPEPQADAEVLEALRLCYSAPTRPGFWERQRRSLRKRMKRWFGWEI